MFVCDGVDVSGFHSTAFTRSIEISACMIEDNQLQCIQIFILKLRYFMYPVIIMVTLNAYKAFMSSYIYLLPLTVSGGGGAISSVSRWGPILINY